MPVQVSFPGVYVQEVPSGVRTITGVSTSIAMFIGMTGRGRLNEPTRVLSFADYERAFGNDTTISEMTDQVRQFFTNGGQQAFIARIANGATGAQVALNDELSQKEVLRLRAKDAGTVGNAIRVEVDYDTPSPESSFNLRAFRLLPNGRGGFDEAEEEVFKNLNMNPDSGLFAVDVITQRSALMNAERGADFNDAGVGAFKGYALSGRLFDSSADPNAEVKTALENAITATGADNGQLRISVDGNPFFDVVLKQSEIPAAAADILTFLQDSINNTLLNVGATVTVALTGGPADRSYLQFQSDKDGGSVVFRSASSADITGAMQLGIDRGGFEVDGHAKRRPAPTGLAFRLGDFEGTPILDALTSLADQDQTDITEYELLDSSGTHSFTGVNLGPGGKMYEKTGEADSLSHVKERLRTLASKINSDSAASADFKWFAAVQGYRLVLTPNFGNANTAATSFETGPTYDLGGAGQGMDEPNVRFFSLGATGAGNNYQTAGANGVDGGVPILGDYTDAFLAIDRQVDLFNLLILPRASGQTDTQREAVWGPASNFCLNRRAFLIMDPRSDAGDWADVNEVVDDIEDLRIGLVNDHAAIYWPRLAVTANGTTKIIDPSGSIAGLMARTDSNRGVWKAPAGIEASIRGVRGVQRAMSDPENGIINPQAVNAIRVFPTGIVSWGARTMDGFDNSGNDDYKYVPVRRLALFIEESLYRGLKFAVFEPNDEPLWAQIRVAAGAFMNNLFRQGAFQGQKASDAYFVKVDSETTTQNDINLGIVNVVVGFAPLKPAEFVIITIQQKAGQVQT
jgi:phage tail sheath protein FI